MFLDGSHRVARRRPVSRGDPFAGVPAQLGGELSQPFDDVVSGQPLREVASRPLRQSEGEGSAEGASRTGGEPAGQTPTKLSILPVRRLERVHPPFEPDPIRGR